MGKKYIIFGGLPCECDFRDIVRRLNAHTQDASIEWQWVYCEEPNLYTPPDKPFNRAIEALQQYRRALKNGEAEYGDVIAIRLHSLHNRSQGSLYSVCYDPVLVPQEIPDGEALFKWLLSGDAGLVPHDEWFGTLDETAIVSILCKLLQNKSWNKDTQGHQWTKDEDLFGQSPVMRSEYQEVRVAANKLIKKLKDTLLLKKGGSQGKTPLEWAIDLAHLPKVKDAILSKSLDPLRSVNGLEVVIESASSGDRKYDIGNEVVKERVRQLCRDKH